MSKLCKDCACENVCGITHLPEDKACVYYKADAITELEKIKAEIIACTQQEEGEVPACINYGIKLSTEIVEKHIAELKKGENNV